MIFISVVRNHGMYNSLVKGNAFNQDASFIAFDNSRENLGIPERYNSYLDSYDYSVENWFVFCHEDWELKENLTNRLSGLNKTALYGPIGIPFGPACSEVTELEGQIYNSNKDGSDVNLEGRFCHDLKEVGTFDSQCLIVHSSLIKKYNLRFDVNFSFDLYVEDFCIWAREICNIPSFVLQLKCQHYSYGNIGERFYEQFNYLCGKYKKAKNRYRAVCLCTLIGRSYMMFDLYIRIKNIIYRRKVTKSGRVEIKFLKIPIWFYHQKPH